MSLWLINAALALLVLLLLLRPFVTRTTKTPGRHGHRHLLASRLAEIERECSVGLIDAGQRDRARQETEEFYRIGDDAPAREKTPLAAMKIAGVTTLFILVATGFYFQYSDGHRMLALDRQARQMIEEINSAIVMLQDHLEENPRDTGLRLRLADTYYLIGNYAEAVAEYRRVEELDTLQENEQWLSYADAMLRSGEIGQSDGVVGVLDKLLGADPDNQRALLVLASLHFEREEYAQAIGLWQRLLKLIPADESGADAHLREVIARAEDRLTAKENRGVAKSAGAITITVSLAPELRSAAAPDDTVFVYARAIGGSPMPVAIKRLTVSGLPTTVTLADDDAMMESMSLGQFEQVEVVARVAKRGQAVPAKGDLVGTVSPVAVGGSVAVEIGEVVD